MTKSPTIRTRSSTNRRAKRRLPLSTRPRPGLAGRGPNLAVGLGGTEGSSMSLNKAMIIGNLGRDPEMRYTANGQAVTQFTVAVNRNFKDASGEWKEETEWFRVVAWGPLAERTAEHLRKGRKVYVEGRLQTRQWEGQDGQKHYTTELIANTVTGLDPRPRD